MKKKICLMLLFILTLGGCGISKNENENTKIVTTIGPLAALVDAFKDSSVSVDTLLPADADYHHFEPSSSDIKKVADANIFIYVDSDLEPFVETIKNNLPESVKTIELSELEEFKTHNLGMYGEEDTHDHDTEEDTHDHDTEEETVGDDNLRDVHFWFSPKSSKYALNALYNELKTVIKVDEASFEDYRLQLDEISGKYEEFAQTNFKSLVVNHDSLQYLYNDYGLRVVGVYGADEHDEPSSQRIQNIIDLINREEIKSIFSYPGESSAVIESISSQTGADIVTLSNGFDAKTAQDFADFLTASLEGYQKV